MNKVIYYFNVMIKSFKAQYVYKAQVVSKILYCILLYLIQMHIWQSVNESSGSTFYNIDYMSGYVLISSIIGVFIAFDMNYIPIIESKVRMGTISDELTKPISFLAFNFFEYLGKCLFKFLFNAIPLCLFFIIYNVKIAINYSFIGYFLLALTFSIFIFFLINVICGMLSFWFVSIGNLHIIIDSSITLFSGAIIPLWLVPTNMQFFFEVLPFKYLFYYPITIFLGLLDRNQIYDVYLRQLLWAVLLFIIARIIYYFGIKKVQIFG